MYNSSSSCELYTQWRRCNVYNGTWQIKLLFCKPLANWHVCVPIYGTWLPRTHYFPCGTVIYVDMGTSAISSVEAKRGLMWDLPRNSWGVLLESLFIWNFRYPSFTIAALSSIALGIIQIKHPLYNLADDRRNTLRPSSQGGIAVLLCFQNTVGWN